MTLIVIVVFFLIISIQIHSLVDYTKLEFKMKKKKKDNADIELADSSHTGAKPPL